MIMVDRILALFVLALVLGLPLGLIFLVTGQFLMDFVFFYPLFMSALWIAGGLFFWFFLERHWPWGQGEAAPQLPGNLAGGGRGLLGTAGRLRGVYGGLRRRAV